MIHGTMDGTRSRNLPLWSFLLLSGALAASAQSPSRHALDEASTELRGFLAVRLACESCTEEQSPRLGALWRPENEPERRRTLTTASWSEGLFDWVQPNGRVLRLQGEPLRDGARGWLVQLPLESDGLPFRLMAQLEGYTAPRLAHWPARDGDLLVAYELQPVPDLLDEHPEWSIERNLECDLLVPRSLGQAVTFFSGDRPVAWLYGAGTESWRFQFVRPGGTLLDRVTVDVQPSDEGDHLAFRLPLAGLLGHGSDGRVELGALEDISPDEGLPLSVRVGAAGLVGLADCPRIPLSFDPEVERPTDGF